MSEIWKDDKLDRAREADMIKRFILNQMDYRSRNEDPRTYVLNIDSAWGEGKSFFLERFHKSLEEEGYISVLVNAWEDDYQNDPILSVFSQIKSQLETVADKKGIHDDISRKLRPLKRSAGEIAAKAATGGAKQLLRKFLGEDADEIIGAVGLSAVEGMGEAILESFEKTQATISQFRELLSALVKEVSTDLGRETTIFILIDELDRCRPDYAILLLERVKHLFSVEGVAFILATDTEQLAHAVSGAYGGAYDGRRYLRRFFDRTYKFPDASRKDYVEEKFGSLGLSEAELGTPPDYSATDFLTDAFEHCAASLRDIRQMMEILQTFCSVWPHPELKIEVPYLLPDILANFIQGEHGRINGKDIGEFTVTIVYYEEGRNRKKRDISINEFRDTVNRDGHDIFHTRLLESRDPLSRWVDSIFSQERATLHNNRFHSASPPGTILFSYPKLLKVVGRFDDD